jgi:hypothetical protein
MFTVTDNITHNAIPGLPNPTPGTAYTGTLDDTPFLKDKLTNIVKAGLAFAQLAREAPMPNPPMTAQSLAPITSQNLLITTDGPSYIHSGWGDDTIIDNSNSKPLSEVVIDPGRGNNKIQASSNPTSHDTIIVDPEPDQQSTAEEQSKPLIDTITGLKAGDNVLIKGLTTLSPNDFTNAAGGLTLTIPLAPATSPAQVVLSGYTTNDFANGRLTIGPPFNSTNPDVSSYQLLQVGP